MVAIIALLTFSIVSLGILFVSLAFGSAISRVNGLAYSGIALLVGALVWLGAILYSPALSSISFVADYSSSFQQTAPASLKFFGDSILSAVLSVIVIIEIGMLGGYGIGRLSRPSAENVPTIAGEVERRPAYRFPLGARVSSNSTAAVETVPNPASSSSSSGVLADGGDQRSGKSPLSPLERTIIQLLLFGGVSEIRPTLDYKNPEGYYFEQLKGLDLDTKRQANALVSLANRGFLNSAPQEKILHCSRCDATNLEFQGTCPECGSLSLSKQKVLEHFPCGMIEKESAFRTAEGDLLCPKCNKKLELIGNDYRSLGLMYICQNCGALSKELEPTLKCRNCGLSASPDEEREEYLYSYSLNQDALQRIREFVKPTEKVVNFFRSLGYTIYAPAFVRGRSGTEQTFDLMVHKDSRNGPGDLNGQQQQQRALDNQRILVEILASDKPIELEDITKEFGKISDVGYKVMVVVVPTLSEKARNYAEAYGITLCEGRTIEEALASADKTSRGILAGSGGGTISSNVRD